MKKILLVSLFVFGMVYPLAAQAGAFNYLEAPNGSNRNFSGLMQRQFEKEETLDFIDNPEEYKIKREKKDTVLDYQEGKIQRPEYRLNSQPAVNKMEFTKDDNGQIKIQGIQ